MGILAKFSGGLLAAFFVAQSASAATFDLAADFDATVNGSGAWTYGGYTATDDASSFTAFTTALVSQFGATGLNGWFGGSGSYMILKNETAGDLSPGTPVYKAGKVTFHPNIAGLQAVARWTAQAAGVYDIMGLFSASDLVGSTTTTDGSVFVNAASVFSGAVSGAQSQDAPFSFSQALTAGDTVDFVVGFGSDGSYLFDTTQVDATITMQTAAIPLPAGLPLMLVGLGAFAIVRRRVG